MLLTPQLEPFSPQTVKHFVHEKVPIQLQGLWHNALILVKDNALLFSNMNSIVVYSLRLLYIESKLYHIDELCSCFNDKNILLCHKISMI